MRRLRRHIASIHGLTPEAYRRRWDLPRNYPLVCAELSRQIAARAHANDLAGQGARARKPWKNAKAIPRRERDQRQCAATRAACQQGRRTGACRAAGQAQRTIFGRAARDRYADLAAQLCRRARRHALFGASLSAPGGGQAADRGFAADAGQGGTAMRVRPLCPFPAGFRRQVRSGAGRGSIRVILVSYPRHKCWSSGVVIFSRRLHEAS